MDLKFVEASQDPENGLGNWGKFAVGLFTYDELREPSAMPDIHERSLIMGRGRTVDHVYVMDLQTGEGAMFLPGGLARADLNKHRIWVCPLFEPFLTWLYRHITETKNWFTEMPRVVALPDAEFDMYGYRRPGPDADA